MIELLAQGANNTWLHEPKLIIVAAIVILFLLVRASGARQRRELSHAQDKVCAGCGSGHPPFAVFCRKCGKKL